MKNGIKHWLSHMKPQQIITLLLLLSNPVTASTIDDLLQRYISEGAGSFSATNGENLWINKVAARSTPKQRSCTTCHGTDLTVAGKHQRTGKKIAPMAISVNKKRFTDAKKVEKWFKRNCKWTWGRECAAQEKGDILLMFKNL